MGPPDAPADTEAAEATEDAGGAVRQRLHSYCQRLRSVSEDSAPHLASAPGKSCVG